MSANGSENQITPANEQDALVFEHLSNTDFHLALLDEEPADMGRAVKLSIEALPELGLALSSLPGPAQNLLGAVDTPKLLAVTDKYGNPLDPSILHETEGGLIGSYGTGYGGLRQARFHEASGVDINSITSLPYDPTSLFVAAALAQINQKLDSIQSTVDEIPCWMQQEKRTKMHGNLKMLMDLLGDYKLNHSNPTWMNTAHNKVFDILQEAKQNVEFYHAQTTKALEKKTPLEMRVMVNKRLNDVLDNLKDYQTTLYMYSFALFMDPVLSNNFDSTYLQLALHKIEESADRYKMLYTRCYNTIGSHSLDAADTVAVETFAHAAKKLGGLIEKTPVGERTPIDEGLAHLGDGAESFNDNQNAKLLDKLHAAKAIDASAFEENLKTIDLLHNQPTLMACDAQNVYLLPAA